MSKYIDADALIEELKSCSYLTWSKDVNRAWWAQAVKVKDNIVMCIERQPSADVVEVVHAYWETVTELKDDTVCGSGVNIRYRRCSHCKYPMGVTDNIYCGHCGAKMDGERSENGT